MAKFLLRRLANYGILVAVATSCAYILAAVSLHPRANFEGRNRPPPEAVVDARLTELNLNDKTPVLQRYKTWAGGVLHGDFGKTWDGESVNAEMARRIGVSLRVLLIATVIGGLLGVLAGAWGRHTPVPVLRPRGHDAVVRDPVDPRLRPGGGARDRGGRLQRRRRLEGLRVHRRVHAGAAGRLLDARRRPRPAPVLPSLTLILGEIAIFSRYQRSAILDVLGQDFVRTAQAKGLRRRSALLRHALRTALIPAVTYFIYSFGISSSARPSRRRSSAGTAWESGSWTPSLPRTRTRSAVHKNLANVGSYGFAQPDYTKIGFLDTPS
jgi:glutathione transport system permease protein